MRQRAGDVLEAVVQRLAAGERQAAVHDDELGLSRGGGGAKVGEDLSAVGVAPVVEDLLEEEDVDGARGLGLEEAVGWEE